MSDDPFDQIEQAANKQSSADTQKYLARLEFLRRVRWGLRWTLYGSTLLIVLATGGILWGISSNHSTLVGICVVVLLVALALAIPVIVTLYFMGGLAPPWVMALLSESERRRLYD